MKGTYSSTGRELILPSCQKSIQSVRLETRTLGKAYLLISSLGCIALAAADNQHCVRRKAFVHSAHMGICFSDHSFLGRVLLLAFLNLQNDRVLSDSRNPGAAMHSLATISDASTRRYSPICKITLYMQ